jgi:hypothetical protein
MGDKVWHRGLLKKLKAYGISRNLLHWFENYLSDRNQKVVLQNCFSEVGTFILEDEYDSDVSSANNRERLNIFSNIIDI